MSTLIQLRRKIHEVLHSPYSDFYRNLYRGKVSLNDGFPGSWEEWTSLPLLTKADLQHVPYQQRLYVPKEKIYRIHQTSGTTGAGITVLPRTRTPYHKQALAHFNAASYIGFMYPHSGYEMFTPPGSQFIGGDPARLQASAVLASRIAAEGIAVASASLAIEFASELQKSLDLLSIKHILLQGDICTRLQRKALSRLYPNAKITMIYLCAEMQGVAVFPALPAIPDEPNGLEPSSDIYAELADERGGIISEPNTEGNLIVSVLQDGMALPLLRYTPGDRATFLVHDETRTVFKVVGRNVNDRLRLSVGQIVLRELERAVEMSVPDSVTDFQATLEESGIPPLPFLSLTLYGSASSAQNSEAIARLIQENLRITPERTYADGMARGICAPIVCTVSAPEMHGVPQKRQRLVDGRAR
ncbi:hypothetical protein K8R03_02750 [Candidatus Kaiserbacteria bacterium]|nr:hypothetical protein [Candidatus Kaiserbacteria bacterium]